MRFAIIVALMLLTSPAVASDWVYKNGYWWQGDQPYLAQRVYQNGCYTWKYTKLPTYKDPDWRSKLTDVIVTREKYAAQAKASALEHAEWQEAVAALGQESYSVRYAQGYGYGSNVVAPAVQQGHSIYTEAQSINLYNPSNLDVQWNQADRHVERALGIGSEAMNGFRETLREAYSQDATAKERVAAIYAKAELLKAADTPEVTIKKYTTASGASNIASGASSASRDADIITTIQNKCVNCHNASEPKGGIDMTKYLAFDANTKAKIQAAITNPDPEQRMPLKKEGDAFVPGEALSFDELVLFK